MCSKINRNNIMLRIDIFISVDIVTVLVMVLAIWFFKKFNHPLNKRGFQPTQQSKPTSISQTAVIQKWASSVSQTSVIQKWANSVSQNAVIQKWPTSVS
jgi:hypothetical protein